MPCLGQKSKRKTRRKTETVFLISAALIELQLEIGNSFGTSRQKRKIRHSSEDSRWRRNHGDPLQTAIRQPQPLLFLRAVERKRERRSFPLPLLGGFLPLLTRRDDPYGKRGEYTPRVAKYDAPQHRTSRKDMLRQMNIEFEMAQHPG